MLLFHASPRAGRRQRTTATALSGIASRWPLGILPHQFSRSLRLLAPTFPAKAHRPRNAALTQPQAPLRANGHGPATRPSGFATASWRFVPFSLSSSLISDPGANKNMRLKRSDWEPRQHAPHRFRMALQALPNLRSEACPRSPHGSFRRKTGDPPDPGQRSVEIFLDDHTVNVRKLLGDLDQGLAQRLRSRVLCAHAEGRLNQAHF